MIMELLQYVSIALECVIAAIFAFAAVRRGKTYCWFFAATFALYVGFDLARTACPDASGGLRNALFLAATASALAGAIAVAKQKK